MVSDPLRVEWASEMQFIYRIRIFNPNQYRAYDTYNTYDGFGNSKSPGMHNNIPMPGPTSSPVIKTVKR